MKDLDKHIKIAKDGTFFVRMATHVGEHFVQAERHGLLTKGQARAAAKDCHKEYEQKKAAARDDLRLTWKRAVDEYVNYPLHETVSQRTLLEAQTALNAHTKDWYLLPVEEITAEMIKYKFQFVCGHLELSTRNNLLKYARAVLRFHVEVTGKIKKNPAKEVTLEFDKDENGKRIRKPKNVLEAMSRPDMELLLREAERQQHPWFEIWYVHYGLGIRRGEGKVLEKDHVDFAAGVVHIVQAYDFKTKHIGPPKNGKPRTIDINPTMRRFLEKLMKERPEDKYLLPQFKDWEYDDASGVLKAFQASLGIKQTNFHSLRASHITHLLLRGIPDVTVMKMVGHADLKTTQRYVRLCGSDIIGATAPIAVPFGGDTATKPQSSNIIPFRPRASTPVSQ